MGAAETALKGVFGDRARAEGRPGATLGLIENRFLLWTAAEELEPSPFWSSLQSCKNLHSLLYSVVHNKSSGKTHFRGHLLLVTHPGAVGFSDGVTTDLLSVTAAPALLSPASLGVSSASWFTDGAS